MGNLVSICCRDRIKSDDKIKKENSFLVVDELYHFSLIHPHFSEIS